jgi:hypothetical protein
MGAFSSLDKPTHEVCQECKHWTRDDSSYALGNCDQPKTPPGLTHKTFVNFPMTAEMDTCDLFDKKPE